MSRSRVRPGSLALLLTATAVPLWAQGSSVYNHSACASARAGAVIASPCFDGSSVFYNPAAIATMPSTVSAGLNVIFNSGDFAYDSTGVVVEREATAPVVPHAYLTQRFSERLAAGVGFFAPYGLGIEWPEEFEGRFISWKTRLQGLYLQPTVAFQVIPRELSLGAGLDVVFGGIEVNQHVDAPFASTQLALLGVPPGTDIASATLSGDGVGFGGHVALLWQPSDRFAVGVRYMHSVPVELDGDGDFEAIPNPDRVLIVPDPETGDLRPVPLDALVAAEFEPGGPLEDQSATAELEFPAQAVVGVKVGLTPRLDLTGDYQWTGWDAFDRIDAAFENGDTLSLPLDYEDAHTFRTGLRYDATPALELRGGFIYNTAASPDASVTPILPEAERQHVTLGLGYRLGEIRIDGYYHYIDQADRRGRVRSESLLPVAFRTELNTGVYSNTAHLIGLTISYVFGGAN